MAKSEFVNYIIDLLSPYGYIRVRSMFGGHSVYKDGVIVAIIIDDELYFKVVSVNLSALIKDLKTLDRCYMVGLTADLA